MGLAALGLLQQPQGGPAAAGPGAALRGLPGRELGADLGAAVTAGAAVAPLLACVDRAVTENAARPGVLWGSFFRQLGEVAARPGAFFGGPAFRWLWFVYGGTYFVANAAETAARHLRRDAKAGKLAATSAFNSSASLAKDSAFAALYGRALAPVPLASYATWLSRDVMSMGVFFTLPPIVGREVAKVTGSEKSGYYAAQFCLPLAFQAVVTPVHLLGLDFHNNRGSSWAQRGALIAREYKNSTLIRMLRMCAPYSLGTIGNRELRGAYGRLLGAAAP